MTPTNTTTILRQMGAMGGCGGYRSDDLTPKSERSISIQQQRIESAWAKYSAALIRIGRPALPEEVADEAGTTKSSVQAFVRKNPDRFKLTIRKTKGAPGYLIELRDLDEVRQ